MLSDLLLALVIHVKCTKNAVRHRNTYLKCNRLKFTLNRARRALIQPRRRTGNGSTVRTVEPLMRHAWIMEYSGKPKGVSAPPPGGNSPRQELKCLSFYLITRPSAGKTGATSGARLEPRRVAGGKEAWVVFFLPACTGGGVKSTFVLPAAAFRSIRKTSLPLTYSWIHNLQVADN